MNKIILSVIFGLWCFGAEPPPEPQCIYGVSTVHFGMTAFAVAIAEIDIEIARKEGDAWLPAMSWTVTQRTPAGQTPTIPFYDRAKELPNGTYRYRMRVRTEARIESPLSEWYYATKDWSVPEQPTGCALFR